MGAVRMRVHQLMSFEVKSCVCKKNFKPLLQLKYESSIQNVAFFSEKVVSSESGDKYGQIKQCSRAKTAQNRSNKYV